MINQNNNLRQKIIWISIFSIAMGFLESAVVVYIRAILYPDGFAFPLQTLVPQLALTEILREAATIIMLLAIGILAGKTFSERFAWFLFSFAVWDLFYYVFLKLLLNWPESFLTWDVLFLIPLTWVGPVISPCILAVLMIVLAAIILYYSQHFKVSIRPKYWVMLSVGALIDIVAFTWDYSAFLLKNYSFSELVDPRNRTGLMDLVADYVPHSFPWLIFVIGTLVITTTIIHFAFMLKTRLKKS